MKLNHYISYTEGKCRRCGHDIKPRYKGRHCMGVCHQCRMKELAQMTKGVKMNIAGRESPNRQCYECANCSGCRSNWGGSSFHCDFTGKDYHTWHMDVPNEAPCKGKGWVER